MNAYEHRDIAIAKWTEANIAARRAYHLEPFAGTRAFNDADRARERMRASRAAKKEQQ